MQRVRFDPERRLYTRDGLLSTVEIPEADLQSSEHPLFPCYAAAQHVLTQVLKTTGKK